MFRAIDQSQQEKEGMNKETVELIIDVLKDVLLPTMGAGILAGIVWLRNRGPEAIARALAVGYYYSFVNKIGVEVERSSLVVKFDHPEKLTWLSTVDGEFTFRKHEVRIEFFIPKHLTKASMENASREANGDKAAIHLPDSERDRSVNYAFEISETGHTLVIKDYVATYYTLQRYVVSRLKLTQEKDPASWQKLEKAGLTAFHEKLFQLMAADNIFENEQSWRWIPIK